MKYELLLDDTKTVCGHALHRVKYAERAVGGWVESKENLPEEGKARVLGKAKVFGDAYVGGNAHLCGNENVHDGVIE